MICLPNRKRALAVSSIRDLVRKRIGAPLTIITSPWRSSNTKFDMRPFLVRDGIMTRNRASPPVYRRHGPPSCSRNPPHAPPARGQSSRESCRLARGYETGAAPASFRNYLNRLSSVCGAWFAKVSAWVPSCC